MDLKDFIAVTLQQIIDGVRIAQQGDLGTNVNANMSGAEFGGLLVNVGDYGVATRVDFDVSVSAETSGGAGAKLTVFSWGVEGGAQHSAAGANRVQFSEPIRLPDGDASRANRVNQERRSEQSRILSDDYDPFDSHRIR